MGHTAGEFGTEAAPPREPGMAVDSSLTTLAGRADRLRMHALRSTTAASSGHPTSCMSAAEIASAVFFHAMRYDPRTPRDPAADRFVLSKGHAAPLLYAVMVEFGVLTEADLLTLRRIDSDLDGHPLPRMPFVDVATGSLGQGLSAGIGMALTAQLDGVDAHTYVLSGDGETAEGSFWEAVAWAGHRGLGNLTAIIDVNRLGQSQATMLQHDVATYVSRLESFGWQVASIDGHDIGAVVEALDRARSITDRPSAIVARTYKGKGVSFLENQDGWHGKAVPAEQLDEALAEVEAPGDLPPVTVNSPAAAPATCANGLALTPPSYDSPTATRRAYGVALEKLIQADLRVVAVDGDVKNSTYSERALAAAPERFFEAYIAEQNMLGMATGLAARGKIPFVSTFGAFFSRAYDQLRMAGVSELHFTCVGSHAGVSIGEDGPSQMALEDLAIMRAVHGSSVLYPSDAVSCERLVVASAQADGIVYIRTERPDMPVLYDADDEFPIGGFKILRQSGSDEALVVGAGVTVHEALEAQSRLANSGVAVRVVDLYSLKPIDAEGLIREARTCGDRVVTVEDHYPEGGLGDAVLGALAPSGARVTKLAVTDLPRSGPGPELRDMFGISANHIVRAVEELTAS